MNSAIENSFCDSVSNFKQLILLFMNFSLKILTASCMRRHAIYVKIKILFLILLVILRSEAGVISKLVLIKEEKDIP